MVSTYYFFLGNLPHLSLAELKALTSSRWKLTSLSSRIVSLSLSPQEMKLLTFKLGGTIKIAQKIQPTSPQFLIQHLQQIILASPTKNLAISDYSSQPLTRSQIFQLKKEIQKTKPIRFLSLASSGHHLVALRKQKVLELNILPTKNSLILAKTVWLQNSDVWTIKDRQRPYQDIKRGMLPPKVARIMINLASQGKTGLLADPFCGTGTIALEAASLGFSVFASDLDPQAVAGTRQNLLWLQQKFHLHFSFQTQVIDATHLSTAISHLDYLVTEPFMGALFDKHHSLTPQKLANNIKGLQKLYTGALKNWHHILRPESRVVMIMPEFHLFNQIWSLPLIDTCENLGYNKLAELSYSKPQAVVVRKILVLQKLITKH